jgi:hypothetical protein
MYAPIETNLSPKSRLRENVIARWQFTCRKPKLANEFRRSG